MTLTRCCKCAHCTRLFHCPKCRHAICTSCKDIDTSLRRKQLRIIADAMSAVPDVDHAVAQSWKESVDV